MSANVLTNPDRFFGQRVENPSLWKPAVIVLLAAIASLGGQLVIFQSMGAAFGSGIGSIIGLVGLVVGFVGIFLFWGVLAVLFYLISIAFGGKGGFLTTLKLTGWGYVPSIFSGIISSIATYSVLRDTTIPQSPQAVATFAQSIQNDPVLQTVSAIGLVFTLWQGFIWTFALAHARDLELRQAAITVGIPVAVLLAFNLYSLFFSGSFL